MHFAPISTVADVYGSGNSASFQQGALIGPDNETTSASVSASSSQSPLQTVNLLPALQGINPLVALVVLVGLIVGVKLLREWKAPEGDVKDVKVGAYFIIMSTLAAATGLPLLKGVLAKYRIPGISDYVLTA